MQQVIEKKGFSKLWNKIPLVHPQSFWMSFGRFVIVGAVLICFAAIAPQSFPRIGIGQMAVGMACGTGIAMLRGKPLILGRTALFLLHITAYFCFTSWLFWFSMYSLWLSFSPGAFRDHNQRQVTLQK